MIVCLFTLLFAVGQELVDVRSDVLLPDFNVQLLGNPPELPKACTENSDCDDGHFCNGIETCVNNFCLDGDYPCGEMSCDDVGEVCVNCIRDFQCDDGDFCNGQERCINGECRAGQDPCGGTGCNEQSNACGFDPITTFTLIDPITDQEIVDPMPDNYVVDLSIYNTITIRVNVAFDVGSMSMSLTKNGKNYLDRVENQAPYALFGDDGQGDYGPWFREGPKSGSSYQLIATPYSQSQEQGDVGVSKTIEFSCN